MFTTLIVIVSLLVLSAFFSGSETALTGASKPVMHQLARTGNHRAEIVNRLHDQKERLIGAILLGNNLVNILASALATSMLITTFGDSGVAYATIAMTLLILNLRRNLAQNLCHQERQSGGALRRPRR